MSDRNRHLLHDNAGAHSVTAHHDACTERAGRLRTDLGAQIVSMTTTFQIPFRPSADVVHCPDGNGNGGRLVLLFRASNTVTFQFPTGTTLPNKVIWALSFNTSSSGPESGRKHPVRTTGMKLGVDLSGVDPVAGILTSIQTVCSRDRPRHRHMGGGDLDGVLRFVNCWSHQTRPMARIATFGDPVNRTTRRSDRKTI